jgi:hypothetical protein
MQKNFFFAEMMCKQLIFCVKAATRLHVIQLCRLCTIDDDFKTQRNIFKTRKLYKYIKEWVRDLISDR